MAAAAAAATTDAAAAAAADEDATSIIVVELELISILSADISVTLFAVDDEDEDVLRLWVKLCLRRSQFLLKTLPHDEQLYGLISV